LLGKYFFRNPEIRRYLQINFRYPKALSYIILYILALLTLYTLIYFGMNIEFHYNKMEYGLYFKILFKLTMFMEYVIFFYIGSYLISNSIAHEKEKGTFDFIRLSVIDKKAIAFGKVLGAISFISFLLLITFPFVVVIALFLNMGLMNFLIVHFNLIIYAFLFHSIGLFCGIAFNKAQTANALALIIPVLITALASVMEKSVLNPFVTLFESIEISDFKSNTFNFYGTYISDFIILGVIILYVSTWLIVASIRKLESEENHLLTKKQTVYFTIGTEILITGFFWDKLITGNLEFLAVFFLVNLVLLMGLTAILTPTKDDILIYFNKNLNFWQSIWYSKSPILPITIILNLIVIAFGFFSTTMGVLFSSKASNSLLPIALSISILLFSLIYSQLYFLCNLVFLKNAPTITSVIIVLSFFIPIPLNFLTKSKDDILDLFILNPFITMSKMDKNIMTLANITQFLLLVIILLTLNIIIMTKKDQLTRKYKI